jgi:glutamate carboxypeptidase
MKNQPSLDTPEIKRIIGSFKKDLLVLLDELVAINSYSHNTEGVAHMAEAVGGALPSPLELHPVTTPEKEPLWTCRYGPSEKDPILLVGHLDTVFPPGTFDRGMLDQDPYLSGPGVADMKGGLAVIVGALWALERLKVLSKIPLLLALNGDEEIGSPNSGHKLEELAFSCRFGFVFECGGPDGSVVTSRRGLRRYLLKIKGKAGHAGNIQTAKQSAVVELAHQILKLEGLNDVEAGLSVNVGRVKGGTATNIIPAEAEAELEVRFLNQEQGDEFEERIQKLANSSQEFGLETNVVSGQARPPMEQTSGTVQLFREVAQVAARNQIILSEEARWGASDANLLAAAGLPTIDGLGPVGEMDHSENERILKDSLFQRVELLVHLLWSLREWTHNISDWRSRMSD